MSLRARVRRWRLSREVRRLLDALLRDPDRLRGTSLKPRHASRYVITGFDEDGGRIVCIRFGIVRHPRPHAFSRHSHEVLEYYRYDLATGTVRVERSVNLTRRREAGEGE